MINSLFLTQALKSSGWPKINGLYAKLETYNTILVKTNYALEQFRATVF
jgi:hypothetical protein